MVASVNDILVKKTSVDIDTQNNNSMLFIKEDING